jgi:DNA polymerase III sliding clamp (beta) subunit (PCNA family)|tara:strand:- start:838 stop:1221 length:384 start_codon:yes stop_codon:yes gene_type:complete
MNWLEIDRENTEVRLISSAGTLWEIDTCDLTENGYWLYCYSEKRIHKIIRMEDIAKGKYKFVNPAEEKRELERERKELLEQAAKVYLQSNLNWKVKNPATGRLMKVSTALVQRKSHPAREKALELIG